MGRQEVDPYEILGLERGATWAEIRVAYRRLAKKHHPDKNPGDKTSEWIFKEVGRAYENLRHVHDAQGSVGERQRREGDSSGGSDQERHERQARERREREQRERERAERVRRERERAERRERERWEREQAQAERERWERAQSERVPRAPHEGTGTGRGESRERDHHVVVARPHAVLMAGLVAAILVGLATGIFNRTDDTLPDRAPQSVAGIEREAPTAQSPNPARQVAVPLGASRAAGSGSPPPPNSSGASVRIGTDVAPGRGAQSATEVEHSGPARQHRGTATDRPARAPVDRDRASEYASTIPAGPPRSTDARVGDATVGRHAPSPSDRSELAATVANVTGSEFFTRGSHQDQVARVQGAPTEIDSYPASGYEIWKYGRDTVRISTGSRQVAEWANATGKLKVRLIPGPNVTGSEFFTRGSHQDQVARVQGAPTEIDSYPASGYEIWKYGRDTVRISTGSRQVAEWSNATGKLRVRLIPGPNVTGSEFFTRGSHQDQVARVQGTPTEIDSYPASGYEIWKYGRDTVRISTGSRQVIEWSNRTGNLQVR